MTRVLALLLALVAGSAATGAEPAKGDDLPDPAELVQTVVLDNGLTVHVAAVPGDPTAVVSVLTPLGSGDDPRGLEELAHLTEHLMFTPPRGVSEAEFTERILALGGDYNGYTKLHHTRFFASVPSEHVLEAIHWLHEVIAPRPYTAEDLDRERAVVHLEKAQPWKAGDWLAVLAEPPWLERPGRWERALGIPDPQRGRFVYPYRSLRRITLDDVHAFHQALASAGAMSVFVAGDLDPRAVLDALDQTFATLPRGRPEEVPVATGPPRPRALYQWKAGESLVTYRIDLLFADPDEAQWLQLHVLRHWLDQRLERALRHGEDKLAYGVKSGQSTRHRATDLWLKVEVDPSRFADVAEIIDLELESLRGERFEDAVFRDELGRVVNQLRADSQTALELRQWHDRSYAWTGPGPYSTPVAVAEGLRQGDLAALLAAAAVETSTIRPVPGGVLPWTLTFLGLCLLLGVALRQWWRPPRVGLRLRYVSWFSFSWRDLLVILALPPVALVGAGPWLHLVSGVLGLADRVDSLALHVAVVTVVVLAHAAGLLVLLAHLPARLVVLTDEVRLQTFFSRARRVPVEGVQLERRVWLHQAIRREGWVVPRNVYGALIRTPEGPPVLACLRDPDEALEALRAVRGGA